MLRQLETNARLNYQRLTIDWYASDQVAIQLGGFGRVTTAERCAKSDSDCAALGKSKVTAVERAVLLGVAAVSR